MPPRTPRAAPVAPARSSSRRSGVATEFQSLDLYARGRIERSAKKFEADKNHNGVVKAEVITPVSTPTMPPKKRAPTVIKSAPTAVAIKKQRRSSSPDADDAKSTTTAVSIAASSAAASSAPAASPTPRGRGRPKGSTSAAARAKSIVAAAAAAGTTPAAAPKQPRAKSVAPKKQQQQPVVKVEVKQDGEEEEEQVREAEEEQEEEQKLQVQIKKRGRKSNKSDPASSVAGDSSSIATSTKDTLHDAIDRHLSETNPMLPHYKKKELVTQLAALTENACEKTMINYSGMLSIVKLAAELINTGVNTKDMKVMKKDLDELQKTLDDERAAREAEAEEAAREAESREKERREMDRSIGELEEKVVALQAQLVLVQNREENARRAALNSSASSASSSSSRGAAASAAAAAAAASAAAAAASRSTDAVNFFVSNPVMTPGRRNGTLNPTGAMVMPQPQGHNGINFPRGAFVERSHAAGNAVDLIGGISGIHGMDNVVAQVITHRATTRDHTNTVQHRVTQRIEQVRLESADEAQLEALRRQGFEMVPAEFAEDDEEDDEDEYDNGRIREMRDGEDHGGAMGGGGHPIIEEMDD